MPEPEEPEFDDDPKPRMTGRQQYNLVTDTVAGPNVRLKDNLVQGISVLVCMILGAGIGWLAVDEPIPGLIAGAVIGMIVGVFASGLILMIYRMVKHVKQDHD